MHDDCEFCRIIAGEGPAAIVYEDERVIAFLDRYPATAGHTLLVPKQHGSELFALGEETTAAVARVATRLKTAIDKTLDPIGVSLFYTTGSIVGSVDHAHVHLVPRFADDTVMFSLERDRLDETASRQFAEQLRTAL